ncbi:MAG: 50S ribosomal protein L10 [Bdellovibrionales bacterium]|nr:50S ribosomal protein L10 [Bdellovibrionales bacterium]
MNFQEKEAAVADLVGRFENAAATFLVDYKGCGCAELTALRRELRPAGADFAVVKNTLAKRAIADTGAEGLAENFVGPTAVVWSSTDPVSPAKILSNFSKKQESFAIKAGFVDGQVVDSAGVDALASLPSREELLAKLLALMNAPAVQLLQMMNAPAAQLVRTLEAWRVELEKRG